MRRWLWVLAIAIVSATAAASNLPLAPGVPSDCAARLAAITVEYSLTNPSLSIRTPNLRLSEFTRKDLFDQADAIDAMLGPPEHVKYTSLATRDPVRLKGFGRDWATHSVNERFQRGRNSFTVAVRDGNDKILGVANLTLDRTSNKADFGFILHPDAGGKGYGTEVAYGLVKAAFETFGMSEVVADVHVDNTASQRVMEKAGFERTGETKQKADADGVWKKFEVWRLTKKRYLELAGKPAEPPQKVEVMLEPDRAELKRLLEKNVAGLASWGKTDGMGRYLVDAGPIKADLATVLGIPLDRLKIAADRSGSALFDTTILALDSGTRSVTLASTDGTRVVVPDGNRRGFYEAPTRTGTRVVTLASGGAPPTLYAGTEALKLVDQRVMRGSGSSYFFEDKAGNKYTVRYPGLGGGQTEVLMNDNSLWPLRF